MVTVSRHVIRVENTVSYYEQFLDALEVDLNGTMSNYLRLSLLVTYMYGRCRIYVVDLLSSLYMYDNFLRKRL